MKNGSERNASTTPRPLEVTLPIIVRSYDIDFAGIVSNIVYVRWMEDLRMKFLEVHLPLEVQMAAGYAPTLMKTEIHYVRQIRLFEPVIGKSWLKNVTRATWTVGGEFTVNGEIRAVAEQSGAVTRLESGKPVRIPLELREKFARATGTPVI